MAQPRLGSGAPKAARRCCLPYPLALLTLALCPLLPQRLTDLRDCLFCVSDQNAEAMEKEASCLLPFSLAACCLLLWCFGALCLIRSSAG